MDLNRKIALSNLLVAGITEAEISKFDVLVLPENMDSPTQELYDAQDSITLSKLLKNAGIQCANSYDLNLRLPTKERKSNDIWFGHLYIFNDVVMSIVTGVIGSLLATRISERKKKKDHPPIAKERVHIEIKVMREDGIVEISFHIPAMRKRL